MTTTRKARLSGAAQILAHVPDLVLSGSKPSREIAADPDVARQIGAALRDTEDAASYLPNQIFIGAADCVPLSSPGRPWWNEPRYPQRDGRFGVLFSQDELLTALRRVDSVGLLEMPERDTYDPASPRGRLLDALVGEREPLTATESREIPGRAGPLGQVSWGYLEDEALSPPVVLENLAAKASGSLALARLLESSGRSADGLDFVISCSEEAIGDRYQRGGGNMGKAIAEAVGARRASGFDVKSFCAAPIPALLVASSLIEAGAADRIAVVAGGSLPKLGMKLQGHLKSNMPVLEDCLGALAVLVERDGEGPAVRYDAVGRHPVGVGSANQEIFRDLVFEPLARVDLKVTDVDRSGRSCTIRS